MGSKFIVNPFSGGLTFSHSPLSALSVSSRLKSELRFSAGGGGGGGG